MPESRETAPMRPEDVPEELVPWLVGDDMPSEAAIRALLAVVLPAHEAMVRAKVAADIDEATPPVSIRCSPQEILIAQGMTRARRIARGEQP